MEKFFSIGEMAKKNDLSIQRLRYYDKIGLLVPAYTDSTSGYRYYQPEQAEQLSFIQALQYMGFSLQEIKQYLKNADPNSLPDLLTKYRKRLDEEEIRIARKKRLIDRYQGLLERSLTQQEQVRTARLLLTAPLATPIHSAILNDLNFHQEARELIHRLGLSKSYQQFLGYFMEEGQAYLFLELDHSIGAPGERYLLASERQPFLAPQDWKCPSNGENYLLQETVALIDQELIHGYSYETKLIFK
ncbi:MerR family transcriptional regulator [Listeria ilorinensis]|uniref:MerR family transcriptional regulator n=1 Tax=Listeria ilorinensis TaxID=2867439 RepID=UPI001EF6D872|nr:helix-turn-helix domain-containing protein [Listeria ilorinensis]